MPNIKRNAAHTIDKMGPTGEISLVITQINSTTNNAVRQAALKKLFQLRKQDEHGYIVSPSASIPNPDYQPGGNQATNIELKNYLKQKTNQYNNDINKYAGMTIKTQAQITQQKNNKFFTGSLSQLQERQKKFMRAQIILQDKITFLAFFESFVKFLENPETFTPIKKNVRQNNDITDQLCGAIIKNDFMSVAKQLASGAEYKATSVRKALNRHNELYANTGNSVINQLFTWMGVCPLKNRPPIKQHDKPSKSKRIAQKNLMIKDQIEAAQSDTVPASAFSTPLMRLAYLGKNVLIDKIIAAANDDSHAEHKFCSDMMKTINETNMLIGDKHIAGKTALMLAVAQQHEQCSQLLASYPSANLGITDRISGDNAYIIAIKNACVAISKRLLKCYPDFAESRNVDDHKTALQQVVENNNSSQKTLSLAIQQSSPLALTAALQSKATTEQAKTACRRQMREGTASKIKAVRQLLTAYQQHLNKDTNCFSATKLKLDKLSAVKKALTMLDDNKNEPASEQNPLSNVVTFLRNSRITEHRWRSWWFKSDFNQQHDDAVSGKFVMNKLATLAKP